MIHCTIIAGDGFDEELLKDFDTFIKAYPDFQGVYFRSEKEIELLFQLLGVPQMAWVKLNGHAHSRYCDISAHLLPEMDAERYDEFIEQWTTLTNRENSMDEYGTWIFLNGLTQKWNKLKFRIIAIEK